MLLHNIAGMLTVNILTVIGEFTLDFSDCIRTLNVIFGVLNAAQKHIPYHMF